MQQSSIFCHTITTVAVQPTTVLLTNRLQKVLLGHQYHQPSHYHHCLVGCLICGRRHHHPTAITTEERMTRSRRHNSQGATTSSINNVHFVMLSNSKSIKSVSYFFDHVKSQSLLSSHFVHIPSHYSFCHPYLSIFLLRRKSSLHKTITLSIIFIIIIIIKVHLLDLYPRAELPLRALRMAHYVYST